MAQTEDQSDITALWDAALNGYTEASKIDIRSILTSKKSVTLILMQQQHELENFKQFRHNKGKVDRLRSLVSFSADHIQCVTTQIASAASIAFPPCAAILTAFTYVLTASKHVSDDYDTIEGFFDMMQSFLRRLSLLEGKIPPRKQFQQDLIMVFSSMLALSGLAYSYSLKGRFRQWASALVDGRDPKLTSAYDGLHENLKRLESATMLQTLRTTIDIHDEAKAIKESMRVFQVSLDRNMALTEQALVTAMDASSGIAESVHFSREILRIVSKKDGWETTGQHRTHNQLKLRSSRPANLDRLRWLLQTAVVEAAMCNRLRELERETLAGVFDWVEREREMVDIVSCVESLCCVSGSSGMGKSTMAFKIFKHLRKTFASNDAVHVACFFFDSEDPEMRSAKDMLKWCAVQVAGGDARYCESVLRDLRDGEPQPANKADDIGDAWHRLIESKHAANSGRRLIIVIDAINEAAHGHLRTLLNILKRIKEKKAPEIQIIITCNPSFMDMLTPVAAKCIELAKEKIVSDMRHFASSRVKSLPRLQKLGPAFRRLLVRKVTDRADSFVYIAHIMRRLNGLAHSASIRNELENLPSTTIALYELLLSDYQKNRSPVDREVLRHLVAWLAYAKSKLSIGEAALLIDIIEKEHSVNIYEAFDGPLGRLLRISSGGGEPSYHRPDHNQSETDTADSDAAMEEDEVSITEDATNFVHFQERSLRAFFQNAIDDLHGLWCNSTETKVMLFKTIIGILSLESEHSAFTLLNPPERWDSTLKQQARLKQYAATWVMAHFLEIDINKASNAMAKVVLECLLSLLRNKGGCLKVMEALVCDSVVLQGKEVNEGQVLTAIGSWANRATSLPPGYLSVDVQETLRSIACEPRKVYLILARAHVINWFTSENVLAAAAAFHCAHNSLLKSKDLPEVQRKSTLKEYLQAFDKAAQKKITAESFLAVFNAFEDIAKAPMSYVGVAMAMYTFKFYNAAVSQCNIGLSLRGVRDIDQTALFQCKGDSLCEAARLADDDCERTQYLRDALETLRLAIEIFLKRERENTLIEDDRATITYTYTAHAYAAAVLGEFDLVLGSIRQAAKWTYSRARIGDLAGTVVALARANQHCQVIEVLQAIPKADLVDLFIYGNLEAQNAMQEAAKRAGLGQCLLGLYSSASKRVSGDPALMSDAHSIYIPRFHLAAALFARRVLGDIAAAKALLLEVVHSAQSHYVLVELAAYDLADMLLESFRLSADPHAKMAALQETRALNERLAETRGADVFRPAEAPTAVVLALMLRVMGPATERADVLRRAFAACVDLLTDDVGYNDMMALRHLARVLACVEGLEREAQISVTAQLYVLDRGVRERELAEQRLRWSEEGLGDIGDGAVLASAPVERVPPGIVVDDMAEGLLGDARVWCDGCEKAIGDWANGPVYLCVYCVNCDLCEECFSKKLAREKGDMAPDWRIICPEGHRHVKAPVEGWKGVADGKLRIGEYETPFRDWLKDLQGKWDSYWDRHWATGME